MVAGAARLPITRDLIAETERVVTARDAAYAKYPSRRGTRVAAGEVREGMRAGLLKLTSYDKAAPAADVAAIIERIVMAAAPDAKPS